MTMKFGIITDEVSQDLGEALRLAVDYGLVAVELRSVGDRLIHEHSDEELLAMKQQVQDAGLTICALSTPIFKCQLSDGQEVAEHREILRQALRAASVLDVDILRAFTFWNQGEFAQTLPKIVKEFKAIVPQLEAAGRTLVVEPDPSVNASNAERLVQVLQAVDSPSVKALYDPGNHLWDPHGEEPYPFAYDLLRPYIHHVHLKDAVRKDGEPTAVAIGQGDVGYGELLPRLQQDGYNGYLMVETHYRLHRELDDEELKRPQGSGFSDGGYEASKQCLESLRELLVKVSL